jgi:Cutinase
VGNPTDRITTPHRYLRPAIAALASLAMLATAMLVAAPATAETKAQVTAAAIKYLTRTPTPKVTGKLKIGSTLTAHPGSWAPAPVNLTYRWYRGATSITGATKATYRTTKTDAGKKVTVRVTGTKTGYRTVTKTSAARTIEHALTATPVPRITGTPAVGATLTASAGTWTPAPVTLKYVWYRSSRPIPYATRATYKLVASDAGTAVSVRVTGTRTGYTPVTKTSAARTIERVLTATPTPTLAGTPTVGSALTLAAGTWSPGPVTLKYTWYRDGTLITGATTTTYTLTTADAGHKVTARVTGSKAGYTTVSRTAAGLTIAPPPAVIHVNTITGNTTWHTGQVVIIDNELTIPAGVTLRIEAGTQVHVGYAIRVNGTLLVDGTGANPVELTSRQGCTPDPTANRWRGIQANPSATVRITEAHIQCAATGVRADDPTSFSVKDSYVTGGIFVAAESEDHRPALVNIAGNHVTGEPINVRLPATDAPTAQPPVVTGNTVSDVDADTWPIRVSADNIQLSQLAGNQLVGNKRTGLAVAGTYSHDLTVPTTGPQLVLAGGGLFTSTDATTTVPAGATLKFEFGARIGSYLYRHNGGAVNILGTPTRPATLTSVTDDTVGGDTNGDGPSTAQPASWIGLDFTGIGQSLTITHAQVRGARFITISSEDEPGTPAATKTITDSEIQGNVTLYGTANDSVVVERNTTSYGLSVSRQDGIVRVRDNTLGGLSLTSSTTKPNAPAAVVTGNTLTGDRAQLSVSSPYLRPSGISGNTFTGTNPAGLYVAGTLAENWTVPATPFPITTGTLTIPHGLQLTVPAGVTLWLGTFGYTHALHVYGTLTTQGTADDRAVLRGQPSPGGIPWSGGVRVYDGGDANLRGVEFRDTALSLQVDAGGHATVRGKFNHVGSGIFADAYVDATGTDWGDPSGPSPYGTGASVSGGGIVFLPWIGYTPQPEALTPSPEPIEAGWAPVENHFNAFSEECHDVLFVGVRGSGEDYRTVAGNWVNDGYGPMVRAVRNATAASMPPGVSVRQYALDYPARSVPSIIDDLALAADEVRYGLPVTPSLFLTGASAGTDRLLDILKDSYERCGGTERWILAGYSQGAMVVHEALALLPNTSPLAGAVLIADPDRDPNDLPTATMGTAANQNVGIATLLRPSGMLTKLGGGVLLDTDDIMRDRMIDVCNSGDPICNGLAVIPWSTISLNFRGTIEAAMANANLHVEYGKTGTVGPQQLTNIGDNLADTYATLTGRTRTVLEPPATPADVAALASLPALPGLPADYTFIDWSIARTPDGLSADVTAEGELTYSASTPGTYDLTVKGRSGGSLPIYFTVKVTVTAAQ